MEKSTHSLRDKLIAYIETNQVAFQFCDGLLTFTKLDDCYDSSDASCELLDEVIEMKHILSNCKKIVSVEKKELCRKQLSFTELIEWSKDTDVLLLIDNDLLISIPRKDYECLSQSQEKPVARRGQKLFHIGLVDADLLCNGTRHPNLALLKIAGYFRDNGFVRRSTDTIDSTQNASTYELLTNDSNFEDLQELDHIYVSCVFSFVKLLYANPQ